MRIITSFFLLLIIMFVVTYAFCVFIYGSFDSTTWPVVDKALASFICVVLSVVATFIFTLSNAILANDSENN